MQKRHHTVPKCYLENFTDEGGHVWVLDTHDKIFKVKPENILVESNFYTVTLVNGEKSLVVEDTLAKLEGVYAKIFREKISKDIFLTDQERAHVAVFIAALFIRTKSQREGIRRMINGLKETMEEWKKQFATLPKDRKHLPQISNSGESISSEEVDHYLDNHDEHHSLSMLSQIPQIAQRIFDMKWSIWKNLSEGFVTCDNPVNLVRPEAVKKYGPNAIGSQPGLLYKDVELTVPLSKGRLLLAGWILEEDSYLEADEAMVRQMNHRTITNSSERVIVGTHAKAAEIKNKYTETVHNQPPKNI